MPTLYKNCEYWQDNHTGEIIRCLRTLAHPDAACGARVLVDADTWARVSEAGKRRLWTLRDAAAAWGLSVRSADYYIPRLRAAILYGSGWSRAWLIPAGTRKPRDMGSGRRYPNHPVVQDPDGQWRIVGGPDARYNTQHAAYVARRRWARTQNNQQVVVRQRQAPRQKK